MSEKRSTKLFTLYTSNKNYQGTWKCIDRSGNGVLERYHKFACRDRQEEKGKRATPSVKACQKESKQNIGRLRTFKRQQYVLYLLLISLSFQCWEHWHWRTGAPLVSGVGWLVLLIVTAAGSFVGNSSCIHIAFPSCIQQSNWFVPLIVSADPPSAVTVHR